jgi:hypothetical protein
VLASLEKTLFRVSYVKFKSQAIVRFVLGIRQLQKAMDLLIDVVTKQEELLMQTIIEMAGRNVLRNVLASLYIKAFRNPKNYGKSLITGK